jgi:hypothetical protein
MDATYFELEQAALERSLESYKQQEHGKKKRASTPDSKRKNENGFTSQEDSHKVQAYMATGETSAVEASGVSMSLAFVSFINIFGYRGF